MHASVLTGGCTHRSIKLSFSPGVCMAKKVASDVLHALPISQHNAQPLAVPYTFRVPAAGGGTPAGDATISVVANVHITEDQEINSGSPLIEVMACPTAAASEAAAAGGDGAEAVGCHKIGEMFGADSATGMQRSVSVNPMLPTLVYEQRLNHTGTLTIPRDVIANLTASGLLHLLLRSNSTGGPMGGDPPFSGGSDVAMDVKLSPVVLTYPLMSCFVRSVSSGPNLKIFLERPRSYYFAEAGLPAAGGDVTFTIAAKWGRHSRYSGGGTCTIDGGAACAGNVEGTHHYMRTHTHSLWVCVSLDVLAWLHVCVCVFV